MSKKFYGFLRAADPLFHGLFGRPDGAQHRAHGAGVRLHPAPVPDLLRPGRIYG